MIRIIGAIVAVVLAVAGAVVLVFYVQGADQRAQAGAEIAEVYVVTETVPKGTAGEAISDSVKVESVPAVALHPDIVTNLDDLAGLVATADLLPGDQLVEGRFADPQELAASGDAVLPEGTQEVTIALPVERVAGGALSAGSTVGVVVTANLEAVGPDGAATTVTQTEFVFQKMLVTRIAPGTSFTEAESADQAATPVDAIMVTFAATTPQVEKLVWAAEQQQAGVAGIWLTLEPEAADESGSVPVTEGNIFQ